MSETRPLVVLVGPPSSGKTTVGTALAAALGTTFRDTEDLGHAGPDGRLARGGRPDQDEERPAHRTVSASR